MNVTIKDEKTGISVSVITEGDMLYALEFALQKANAEFLWELYEKDRHE